MQTVSRFAIVNTRMVAPIAKQTAVAAKVTRNSVRKKMKNFAASSRSPSQRQRNSLYATSPKLCLEKDPGQFRL